MADDDQRVYYVSGPYSARWESQITDNIERARRAALVLWQQGHAVICPHLNTERFSEGDGIDYLTGYLTILSRLIAGHDVIYMLRGWQHSKGACAELRVAVRLGLLVEFADGAKVVDPVEWASEESRG